LARYATLIEIGARSQLVFQNMFNPSRSLTLVGINLKDLRAENFNPIADAHLQQDVSPFNPAIKVV